MANEAETVSEGFAVQGDKPTQVEEILMNQGRILERLARLQEGQAEIRTVMRKFEAQADAMDKMMSPEGMAEMAGKLLGSGF